LLDGDRGDLDPEIAHPLEVLEFVWTLEGFAVHAAGWVGRIERFGLEDQANVVGDEEIAYQHELPIGEVVADHPAVDLERVEVFHGNRPFGRVLEQLPVASRTVGKWCGVAGGLWGHRCKGHHGLGKVEDDGPISRGRGCGGAGVNSCSSSSGQV